MIVMAAILPDSPAVSHRTNLDVPFKQAKVHDVARKKVADTDLLQLARWIDRARILARMTGDQFAAEIGCHPSRLSKWNTLAEPPQIDRVLLSPVRRFLLAAIAEDTPGCEVETTITVARTA